MNTHAVLLPARTPRSAFGKLVQSETKIAWRVPIGLVFGVAAPVLLLVIFGSIPALKKPDASLGGLTYFTSSFPVLIGFALAGLCLISLPIHLARDREQGILRRMSTTPVPPAWLLAAQVTINLALAVLALGIMVLAGTTLFGLAVPKQAGGFALALVLTIAAMFAIGLWISAIARTASGASIIGQLLLYLFLFSAGLYFPQQSMPPVLRQLTELLPLGAGVHAMTLSMQGTFPSATSLLVLAAWAAVFSFLAVRFFRWE